MKINFSETAVNKAVLKNTLQHPSVLYPATVGILSFAAAAMLGPSGILLAVGIGASGIASASWLTHFFARKERFANDYVQKLYKEMESKRQSHTIKLTETLHEVESEQGINQFDRLQTKFTTFGDLLKQKLNPSELTYSRYMGMAEQVYSGALDNLYDIANTLKGVNIIDHKHINKRLKEIEKNQNVSEKQQREIATLNERLKLRHSQLEKIENYLAQNEEAMTEIDRTIAAIAEMRTESGRATMDIESAMNRLSELAKRAKDYSS